MAETSLTPRSTETRTITGAAVGSFVALALLICGGLLGSLILIAIGGVSFLGSVIWLTKSDLAGVFSIHLPAAAGVGLISVGLYLDSMPLWIAGLVLQGTHALWTVRRNTVESDRTE